MVITVNKKEIIISTHPSNVYLKFESEKEKEDFLVKLIDRERGVIK